MRDDGYELFHRAIVERDPDAWEQIAVQYRNMMVGWARRCQVAELAGEPYENIADEALARAWRALTPERFEQFANLAALLGYLRTCVAHTAIDAARSRAAAERAAEWHELSASAAPEQRVLEQFDREELWRVASQIAASEAEQVVLVERFVLDLPPRVIHVRHPELFPHVRRVYETIRNLGDRLRRSRDLRQLYGDGLAA
jgi:DNA-directed RNA polymerase specialized sigma24 family protein